MYTPSLPASSGACSRSLLAVLDPLLELESSGEERKKENTVQNLVTTDSSERIVINLQLKTERESGTSGPDEDVSSPSESSFVQ